MYNCSHCVTDTSCSGVCSVYSGERHVWVWVYSGCGRTCTLRVSVPVLSACGCTCTPHVGVPVLHMWVYLYSSCGCTCTPRVGVSVPGVWVYLLPPADLSPTATRTARRPERSSQGVFRRRVTPAAGPPVTTAAALGMTDVCPRSACMSPPARRGRLYWSL